MNILAYTTDKAQAREISEKFERFGEQVTIQCQEDKKVFLFMVKNQKPDAILLLEECGHVKSTAMVLTREQYETIDEFISRACEVLEIGNDELCDELLARLEVDFNQNRVNGEVLSDDEVRKAIECIISTKSRLRPEDYARANTILFSRIRGYGVLDQYLEDPSINEIMVNGKDDIYVERAGRLLKVDEHFPSEEALYNVIERIANRAHKQIDESTPIMDCVLEDGSRVNAVLKGICLNGPAITIRKFSQKPFTLDDLVKMGSLTREAADFITRCIRLRYNMVLSGGTASGKTTLVNACVGMIPEEERIISIEDTPEIRIKSTMNHTSMEARRKNSLGVGEISIADLIVCALRMRPDRIIVGEVRGKEAIDMLQAMNTGHDGSLTTAHANSPRDMISRLETMVIQAKDIPIEAVRRQIASALDIIVQVARLRDGRRMVTEIDEVREVNPITHEVEIAKIFALNKSGVLEKVGTCNTNLKDMIYEEVNHEIPA